jgi:hypothetical protein
MRFQAGVKFGVGAILEPTPPVLVLYQIKVSPLVNVEVEAVAVSPLH